MSTPAPIDGLVAKGFEPVRAAFAQNFADGLEIGAGFAALINGEPVVDLWGGYSDRARSRPWRRDTLVPVYSTTKPIAALVIATLVEQSALDYDAPLSAVWPEFAAEGKDRVTLAEALSHQAGIPGFIAPIDPALWLDPPALSAALAALKPLWPPGTASGYHALTWGYIAGEAVRRVSPRSLGTILRETICAPLGVDFWIGLPESEEERVAQVHRPRAMPDLGPVTPAKHAAFLAPWAAPNRSGAAWRRAEIPSANGHGSAMAVAQLFGAYANGGVIGHMRVVDPETFAELIATRIEGEDLVLPFRMQWAAGVMRNNNKIYGPSLRTLAHGGWGGSFGMGDPSHGLSAAYVMNQQTPALQTDARGQRLLTALYACL